MTRLALACVLTITPIQPVAPQGVGPGPASTEIASPRPNNFWAAQPASPLSVDAGPAQLVASTDTHLMLTPMAPPPPTLTQPDQVQPQPTPSRTADPDPVEPPTPIEQGMQHLAELGANPYQLRVLGCLAWFESRNDPNAWSPTNDRGLWQIHFPLHAWRFAGRDWRDPIANAEVAFDIYQESGYRAWTTHALCGV